MQLMFDLDGTLTDSREGITRCIQHALAEAGVAAPPLNELTWCVGPPLAGSFGKLLGTSDTQRIENAIAAYRRRFEICGMFESCLYPGIEAMLMALKATGYDMCVVTAKPRVYALRILEYFEIAQIFRAVYGPELSAREYTKASLIRDARLGADMPAGQGIMVGDRAEDIFGAQSNGVISIAVTWGYGDRAELEMAAPDYIVSSESELVKCLPEI